MLIDHGQKDRAVFFRFRLSDAGDFETAVIDPSTERFYRLSASLTDSGITLRFTPAFEDHMLEHGYDPAYGARPIKRLMQRELVNLLAKRILEGSVPKNAAVTVDAVGGEVSVTGA